MEDPIYGDLKGKTAFITGASSGLGEQFARCLSSAGARVIIGARRNDKITKVARALDNARAVEVDVCDNSSVLGVFEELEKTGEKVHICINNAGIADRTPLFEQDSKNTFEKIIQTNVMGTWYVTKAAAHHMKKNHIQGSIITIGSVNGEAVPAKEGCAYSISKAAVIHMTKTLVGELSPCGIRINCISPGWFWTPMNGPHVDNIIPHIPFGDIASPSEMDGLILYLSSNKASRYVTGSCFTIDGGISWGGKAW